jgi:serpin B
VNVARSTAVLAIVTVLVLGACAAPGAPSAPPSSTPNPSSPPTSTPPATPTGAGAPTDAGTPTAGPDGIVLLRASVPRLPASPGDATSAAGAINAFGLELYRAARFGTDNAVISPASIALALGMTRAGARGTTATELDAVLHAVASPDHAGWLNALDQALVSRNGLFTDAAGVSHEVTLRIANAPFAQVGYPIEDAYLQALAADYGSGLRLVDYAGDTERARGQINGWVDAQTDHRIPQLVKPGLVTPLTRLTLVNAIYLKAPWATPFDPTDTKVGSFTRPDGAKVRVPFMSMTYGCCTYASGPDWQAVDKAYLGDALSLTLILPRDLAAFTASLSPARLQQIVGALDFHFVALSLPKFSIESETSLAAVLKGLGMSAAFDPATADFSGITSYERLHVGAVVHQADISVDEVGTEAAAATAVEEGGMGGGPPTPVRFDRPFLFALRDRQTGAVLFLGQVTDPS